MNKICRLPFLALLALACSRVCRSQDKAHCLFQTLSGQNIGLSGEKVAMVRVTTSKMVKQLCSLALRQKHPTDSNSSQNNDLVLPDARSVMCASRRELIRRHALADGGRALSICDKARLNVLMATACSGRHMSLGVFTCRAA
jgi:hypothetical protein